MTTAVSVSGGGGLKPADSEGPAVTSISTTWGAAGQSFVGSFNTSQQLGGSPLGALGTDSEIVFFSTNPGVGFGPLINGLISFASYPGTLLGGTGGAGLVIQDYAGTNPAQGAISGTVTVGTYPSPPPTVVIDWSCDVIITCTGTDGSGHYFGDALFYNFSTTSSNTMIGNYDLVLYQNVQFATNLASENPLNCLLGVTVSEDEVLYNTVQAAGTLYINSGEAGDTGEVLILNGVTPGYEDVIPLAGMNVGPQATALQVSQDGGTWSSVGSFSAGLQWSGDGAIGEFGTHTLQVRDANTFVESNTVTYTLSENLILDPVSPVVGQAISLAGSNTGSIVASSLVVSQDGGSFTAVTDFSAGAVWTGMGAIGELGTHVLQVKDPNTGAVSNTVTYDLTSSNADCCVPLASNTLYRYRGACGINWNGLTLIGDAYSGVIGQASFDTFQEYGNTMRGLVTAPIIHSGRRRVFVPKVEIDVQTGVGNPECCGFDPQWMLDWSKDGGMTWGPLQIFRSMGKMGQYLQRLRWTRLGQGRQWIFRLQSTDPVRRVIISTFVDWYAGMPTIASEE